MDQNEVNEIYGGLQRLIDKQKESRARFQRIRPDIAKRLECLVRKLSEEQIYSELVERSLADGILLKLDNHSLVLVLTAGKMEYFEDGEKVDFSHIVDNYGDTAILRAIYETSLRRKEHFDRINETHRLFYTIVTALPHPPPVPKE